MPLLCWPGPGLKTHSERLRLLEAVRQNVIRVSREWVECSTLTKQAEPTNHLRSEEILSGPVVTARYLRLLRRTLEEISRTIADESAARVHAVALLKVLL